MTASTIAATGIETLRVSREEATRTAENAEMLDSLDESNVAESSNIVTGEVVSYVREHGRVIAKRVEAMHRAADGHEEAFALGMESDGTRRLLNFMPMLHDVTHGGKVYVIDEVEDSIHPMLIKQLVTLLSRDEQTRGQLIFTTHETCLLDQGVLRTDEIWFAEKDPDGCTRLYSLSDYNLQGTANIENGYLAGRYGAIPFLANVNDLHWNDEQA